MRDHHLLLFSRCRNCRILRDRPEGGAHKKISVKISQNDVLDWTVRFNFRALPHFLTPPLHRLLHQRHELVGHRAVDQAVVVA
jgi:hypothetical protein